VKKKKCNRCGEPATDQTAEGKYQEEIGGLPVNHGWYCAECYKKGLKLEMEAIHGND